MNNLPSVMPLGDRISSSSLSLSRLPIRAIVPTAPVTATTLPTGFLPPVILSSGRVSGPRPDTIELVSDTAPDKKKKGRPSKKEKAREARAAASAGIAALLDSEPKKADIREYFENRIKELSDM